MKLSLWAALFAATFLVGCSKCSQQPQPPPPAETMPQEMAPTEGTSAEALPPADQMNEELPPETPGK